MSTTIYVYICTDGSCRNVERRGGTKKTTIDCPVCGKKMRLLSEEKVG